jgi:hypothetical protein
LFLRINSAWFNDNCGGLLDFFDISYGESVMYFERKRGKCRNNAKIPHEKSYENQSNVKKVCFYVKKFKKVVDICFELV